MALIQNTRNYGLDLLRVVACYMVIQIHAGEYFYIGSDADVLNTADARIVGWYNSLFRSCVPLFVMISGFFMFPVGDNGTFFKKRLSRIVVPFVIWCAVYAFADYIVGKADVKTSLDHLWHIPINYGSEVGHLWFVYMLIGIYLFAPIISPWIETANQRQMEFYLALWAVALSLPYIHQVFPEIWGEVWWNRTPMLYYFSGLLGYVILAAYIKKFHLEPRWWNYYLGALLIIVGYGITALVFEARLPTEEKVNTLELSWGFDTINIAMITAGIFLIFKNVTLKNAHRWVVNNVTDISAKSYGIYLAHIIVLNQFLFVAKQYPYSAAVKIPAVALCTFITTYVIIKCLSYLPKSKWITG